MSTKNDHSQGLNKLWEYFLDTIEKPAFLARLDEIRKKYELHEYPFEKYSLLAHHFNEDLCRLAFDYDLDGFFWASNIERLVHKLDPIKPHGIIDLCSVIDCMDLALEATAWQVQERMNAIYPVLIRISPHASKNDIKDFIEKNYSRLIKPLQMYYINKELKLGKNRKASNRPRNKFIWENKHLPLKEIRSLVNAKFKEYLDEGNIGKIISLENKKRK